MTIDTINPYSGLLIKSYAPMSYDQTESIINATHKCFFEWKNYSYTKRAAAMETAAQILEDKKQEYAELMANEMGKPITSGKSEIEKCSMICRHYAHNAQNYLQDRHIKTEARKSYVTYQPIGVIFAIMPWNFPFWQVFRFACPTLMAGNTALLSHAPISTGTSLAIEALFRQAGFPENAFRSLIIENETATKVIENPFVAAVTFTGSEQTGSIVGANAAKNLKKVVLELGGSDPYIILDDADLELAAKQIILSRMSNSGQVCIAAKRIIATSTTLPQLQNLILNEMKKYKMGSPLDDNCNFGPMARKDLRDKLHQQVRSCIEKGADLLTGGFIPDKQGFYYPPTAISHVKKGMPAYDDELFGPVISLLEAESESHAIILANDTSYGLGAAVFTTDLVRGEHIAKTELNAGAAFVNGLVASDPRLPFGGIKCSGYGRELSEEGIKEFVNTKTIVVK